MTGIIRKSAIFAAAIAAGACTISSEGGSVGEQLGISLGTPDEFLVIASRPIEVPQTFTLPRPEPGAPARVTIDPMEEAHMSLYRRPEPIRLSSASTGEQVLLQGADADQDLSGVRAALADEDVDQGERKYGFSSFLGVPIPANPEAIRESRDVVQPASEAALLRRQGYLTPTSPPGLEDAQPKEVDGFLIKRANPTEEEIQQSIDPSN